MASDGIAKRAAPDRLVGRVVPLGQLNVEELSAWDTICRTTEHLSSPFFSPHYSKAVAKVRPHVYVCIFSRGGRSVGFLPFQFRTNMRRFLRAAEMVGAEMTDYFGLAAEPGLTLTTRELLRTAGLHSLGFTHLDESQLGYGLGGEKPEPGLLMRLDRADPYWNWVRGEHKKFASNTDRGKRQIEERFGPLRFTAAEAGWQAPLQQLMDYKGRQYVETGNENLFAVAWRRRFLEILAECRETTCSGMLSTLYAGETWVASHFGLRSEHTLHFWFPVYNPELSKFSPGLVLMKALIENSPALGIRTIDCGAGDAPYKRACSNDQHTYYRGAWTTSSPQSLIWRAAESVRWRLERLRPPHRLDAAN